MGQTLELVKSSLLVHASLTMFGYSPFLGFAYIDDRECYSARTTRYQDVVESLMIWKPALDVNQLCSYVREEQILEPPKLYRHDATMGWMKRVIFCVPLSYLPLNREGIPEILEQSFNISTRVLEQCKWEESEAANFATVSYFVLARIFISHSLL